jgi:hypothetical protein
VSTRAWLLRSIGWARLYWRAVIVGRVALLLVAETLFLAASLIAAIAAGAYPSDVAKDTLIIPAMLLVALCGSDLVPSIRTSGDLELVVTAAKPHEILLHRSAPVLLVLVLQVAAVAMVLLFVICPLGCAVGLLATPVPVVLAASACLYWNLRLKGPGGILSATLLTILPAILWISSAYLFPDNDTGAVPRHMVILSCLSCQGGLLMAAAAIAAIAWRRFRRPEDLVDSRA